MSSASAPAGEPVIVSRTPVDDTMTSYLGDILKWALIIGVVAGGTYYFTSKYSIKLQKRPPKPQPPASFTPALEG